MTTNIHPIFDTLLKRDDKELLLNQKGMVIWLIGLSGSGKSTIARALENQLHQEGFITQLLDGDNLRTGLNIDLGFSEKDRKENLRRTAEVAKLFSNCGIITICSFITPSEDSRQDIKKILGDLYFEVFVSCPLEVCEQRDVKGIYAKARKGEIKDFTGIDSLFEIPENMDLILHTDKEKIEESLWKLRNSINKRIGTKKNENV